MLRRYIEKTRQKSPSARNRAALLGSAGITGLLLLLWVFVSPLQSNDLNNQNQAINPRGAFSGLINELKSQWANVQEAAPEPYSPPVSTSTETSSYEPQPVSTTTATTSLRTVLIATSSATTTNREISPE